MDNRSGRTIKARHLRLVVPTPRERAAPAPPPRSVFEEMGVGAAVGLLASSLLAWTVGAGASAILAAALAGSVVGAVIGMVLWAGSDHLPSDPVVPVPRDQRRDRPEG